MRYCIIVTRFNTGVKGFRALVENIFLRYNIGCWKIIGEGMKMSKTMERTGKPKATPEAKRKRGRPATGNTKSATSFRLSGAARHAIVALSEESGLSQASVVELALRDLAKRRGVAIDKVSIEKADSGAAVYSDSLSNGGELTASSASQEPLHEYSAGELAAMDAGEFQRPLQ
jgi:hypothetical protein